MLGKPFWILDAAYFQYLGIVLSHYMLDDAKQKAITFELDPG